MLLPPELFNSRGYILPYLPRFCLSQVSRQANLELTIRVANEFIVDFRESRGGEVDQCLVGTFGPEQRGQFSRQKVESLFLARGEVDDFCHKTVDCWLGPGSLQIGLFRVGCRIAAN